ncbi:MarR family winged helix-turn-helix transcriptional regulator [Aurantiacibacter poecillastricola]|uniref:MarR family winged helix-turn-helix transcriptional regulator n=1 Tax=Aurantiacibacter poecillastricola TaxID=3064385 RepID=UPI002740303E|nr:MarR family winged helix-turn-helix transcriptional regulator [Aurantiacibacter sp. 219JJ12-13]MDP5262823.1 MarR family winged helix-turn-helix transcriptional regulator [Aurantiacibacter sp. 219JJ12-13]
MQPANALSQFLPYQLSLASNAVSGRIAMEYRQRWGLSIPEWRVMAVLGDVGPLTQRDLTRRTLMDKVAVNRACKGLEERDLGVRTPNESDGRSHLLDLTEAGRAMHAEIMPLAREIERQMFDGFSKEELDLFRRLLDRSRKQAEELGALDVDEDFGIK